MHQVLGETDSKIAYHAERYPRCKHHVAKILSGMIDLARVTEPLRSGKSRSLNTPSIRPPLETHHPQSIFIPGPTPFSPS